jgi:hypothetical protein
MITLRKKFINKSPKTIMKIKKCKKSQKIVNEITNSPKTLRKNNNLFENNLILNGKTYKQ